MNARACVKALLSFAAVAACGGSSGHGPSAQAPEAETLVVLGASPRTRSALGVHQWRVYRRGETIVTEGKSATSAVVARFEQGRSEGDDGTRPDDPVRARFEDDAALAFNATA